MNETRARISEYIICKTDCPLSYLEALAMNGLAVKATIEDCEKKNFKKIVLALINGESVESQCRYVEEIMQSLRIVNVYIGLTRKYKHDKAVNRA